LREARTGPPNEWNTRSRGCHRHLLDRWPIQDIMGNYRPAPQHTSDKNSMPRAVQSPQCVVQDHDHGGEARAADNEREKILQQLD
jgi:hypothetical protein